MDLNIQQHPVNPKRIAVTESDATSRGYTLEEACILMNCIGYMEVSKGKNILNGEFVIMDYQY